jgi:hypothetical protein
MKSLMMQPRWDSLMMVLPYLMSRTRCKTQSQIKKKAGKSTSKKNYRQNLARQNAAELY